ncbi:classical arabinogalactan protein 26-like [Solanum dulcamara]|uniref:classical arabinogalactan protein 26-like n=1 Tax=Solanum dulcamara TaxID=45834 RepID=UPI0024867B47|nr:classical arabinogalactan protein 26-like [Solanum dulcamara]
MASTSISTRLFLIYIVIFLTCKDFISLSLAFHKVPSSAISAAPALLPNPPSSNSPALSPDISHLFPSPGGSELAPTDSSLPLIPSSPSPPNPDAMIAPGPIYMPFTPTESLPVSSAASLFSSLCTMLVLGLILSWFMQLPGV